MELDSELNSLLEHEGRRATTFAQFVTQMDDDDPEEQGQIPSSNKPQQQPQEDEMAQPAPGKYVPKYTLAPPGEKREAPGYNYYWQYKKQQEQAIITESQEGIMKFFMQFPNEDPKKWHFEQRKWRQTMTGFLIGFFKNTLN